MKVKADAGAEGWTTAKTGTLSGDTVVAYFNKPGVGPEDTRIWTYDAAVVEITGIPADADLALLDYPGDRVDFYEGATVGILKDTYGDIPAGTLVILGTYRGDPVYNYVEIQARYSTTPEAGEVTTIERTMSGEVYLLAEIPRTGQSATPATASLSSCPTWRMRPPSTPRTASPIPIPWRSGPTSTAPTTPTTLPASV